MSRPKQLNLTSPYIFLKYASSSYVSSEREHALRIGDLFEAAGVPVWLDRQHRIGSVS